MTGFKNFIMRGNLIELAVAFIMATAFGAVVTATVALLMDVIGKFGGQPDFSNWAPGASRWAPGSPPLSRSSHSPPWSTS